MGSSTFRDFLPINKPKRYRWEIYVLRWEILQNNKGLLSWTRIVFLHNVLEAMNTLIQERNNHRDICITIKVSSVTQKVKVYLANEESSLASFSTDLGHIFGGDVRSDSGILMRGEKTAWTNICLRFCSHPFTDDLHWHCRVQYCWRHKGAFATLLSIRIQAQIWWHNNYWTIHELSDI